MRDIVSHRRSVIKKVTCGWFVSLSVSHNERISAVHTRILTFSSIPCSNPSQMFLSFPALLFLLYRYAWLVYSCSLIAVSRGEVIIIMTRIITISTPLFLLNQLDWPCLKVPWFVVNNWVLMLSLCDCWFIYVILSQSFHLLTSMLLCIRYILTLQVRRYPSIS